MDENNRHPDILESKSKPAQDHFVIKYVTEDQRQILAEKVLKLVHQFELTDFHIEEQKAFETVRIMYNTHTLGEGTDSNDEELKHEFLKYFRM